MAASSPERPRQAGCVRSSVTGPPRTGNYTAHPVLGTDVTPTVDDLRNDIRQAVGRYERVESTAFTKEALAAICAAVGHDVDGNRLPPKSEMRAAIRERIDGLEADGADRPFRKAELEAIAATLSEE